jgi:hypothetical protein
MLIGGGIGSNGVVQYREFRNSGDNAGSTMPIDGRIALKTRERFVPVYFPNSTDEQAAAGIELAPSTEQIEMDFTLGPVKMQSVRGRDVYKSRAGDVGAGSVGVIDRRVGAGGGPSNVGTENDRDARGVL